MLDLPVTRAIIEMLGEIALLLWGVHMISTGVLRGFGGDLRRVLGKALRHRLTALLAGLGVTLVLQSSTATALMASSFAAAGVIGPVPALATMLGANIGTALVTWALAFDVTLMFPLLLLAGLIMFRVTSRTRPRNIGRALIGLGLVLLALHLLVETFAPGTVAPPARDIVAALTREPLVVLALATLLTWAMHSSIAAVLVIATLAQAGLVTPVAALAMVLGANLGSALNPLVNALSGEPAAIRLPLGNLINRPDRLRAGAAPSDRDRGPAGGRHVRPGADRGSVPPRLQRGAGGAVHAGAPGPRQLAGTAAARPATVRRSLDASLSRPGHPWPHRRSPSPMRRGRPCGWPMSWKPCWPGPAQLLDRDDLRLAVRLRRMDDVLDRLHSELKQFLGELAQAAPSEEDRRRLLWILAVALNLEHAGDVIDKGLLSLAAKRIRRRLHLSRRELAELQEMHEHLLAQLRLATTVFMGQDLDSALRLVEEKERFREFERSATQAQFARVQAGCQVIETGGLQLDIVRELKRIEFSPCRHRPPAAGTAQSAAPLPAGRHATRGHRPRLSRDPAGSVNQGVIPATLANSFVALPPRFVSHGCSQPSDL